MPGWSETTRSAAGHTRPAVLLSATTERTTFDADKITHTENHQRLNDDTNHFDGCTHRTPLKSRGSLRDTIRTAKRYMGAHWS
jgi:hypothetical protein